MLIERAVVPTAGAPRAGAGVSPYGLQVLDAAVPVSASALRLIIEGIRVLWERIVAADPGAENRPLILSYDVHPAPGGPVLIEVNTNAGGILTAIEAARRGNDCCADLERDQLEQRLLRLLQHDLLGAVGGGAGVVAVVDDQLALQPLLGEMRALGELMRPWARQVLLVDAAELGYRDGRLRHGETAIDRIYWRSTDFLLADPAHGAIRRAMEEGTTVLAPTPDAYRAIADKRRFVEWSARPILARDEATGAVFRIAETLPFTARPVAGWYAERAQWVFKPAGGHASRGVYVGKRISRQKLAELPAGAYLAQRFAPHPSLGSREAGWKYDLRFYADRGEVIGAAARVFQGQVVGMRSPGSGFAPIRVDSVGSDGGNRVSSSSGNPAIRGIRCRSRCPSSSGWRPPDPDRP